MELTELFFILSLDVQTVRCPSDTLEFRIICLTTHDDFLQHFSHESDLTPR